MNPLKLKLKNFTVFKNEEVLFENDGIYVVYGKEDLTHKRNAIGKTSLVEAIRFALYGDTKYKDKDRPISFGEKEMEVEFEFMLDDTIYTVKRKRKLHGSSHAQLLKNYEDTEISGVNEVTNEIIRITGVDYNVFQECFYINKIDLKELTATKLINFLKSVLKLKKFDNCRDKAKDCLKKAELKLSKIMGVKETLSKLQSINKNKSELMNIVENGTIEKIKLENQYEEISDKAKKLSTEQAKYDSECHTLQSHMNSDKKALLKIKDKGICPMCETNLKNDKLEKQIQNKISEVEPKIESLDKKSDKIGDQLDEFDGQMNALDKRIDSYNDEINNSKYQLEVLNESGEINSEKTEKEYKRLLDLKTKVEYVVDLFSPTNFPLYILNQYLPNLELIVNGILGEVSDFSIEIITDKETKSGKTKRTCELVIYKNGKEYDVHNLSGGEETIINMAFKIGVSKMFLSSTNFNLLIIDEGFGKLGEVNQKTVTEMIVRLKDTFKKIMVISHVDTVRSYLQSENKIDLLKKNGFTKIITEDVNSGV